MKHLINFKNLTDWALRAHPPEPGLTLPQLKDRELDAINEILVTNYQRKHIDNWLAERAEVPKRVKALWVDGLLQTELGGTLGNELRRLVKK